MSVMFLLLNQLIELTSSVTNKTSVITQTFDFMNIVRKFFDADINTVFQ